jgi:hypothetical protein
MEMQTNKDTILITAPGMYPPFNSTAVLIENNLQALSRATGQY